METRNYVLIVFFLFLLPGERKHPIVWWVTAVKKNLIRKKRDTKKAVDTRLSLGVFFLSHPYANINHLVHGRKNADAGVP